MFHFCAALWSASKHAVEINLDWTMNEGRSVVNNDGYFDPTFDLFTIFVDSYLSKFRGSGFGEVRNKSVKIFKNV